MGNAIVAVLLGLAAIGCFIFSHRQFRKKGFLFNNAYLYASEQERETMDKKPYYKQSGVVLALIGAMFAVSALDAVLQMKRLLWVTIGIALTAIVYAIVSSVIIEKRKNSD